MRLAQKEQEKFVTWLKDRAHPEGRNMPICPLCGQAEWCLSDTVIQVEAFQVVGKATRRSRTDPRICPDPLMPLVPLACGQCGYTLLFNAVLTGMVKLEKRSAGARRTHRPAVTFEAIAADQMGKRRPSTAGSGRRKLAGSDRRKPKTAMRGRD
jgi:ribosomal protein S27AE